MRIVDVTASAHGVQILIPLLDERVPRPVVFVRVETDQGTTGYGMTGGILRFSTREFINRELKPFLVGKDPLATERLWTEMYWTFNQRGMSGVVQHAISAVDIALWDIKGKHVGLPVWRLLGGYAQTIPAYVTFGLLEYGRDQLVQVAKDFIEQGQDKLKMVVALERNGRKYVAEDAARVRAVREGVGPDVELMLDANHLFTFLEAKELAMLVEPYRVTWFEEPVYANDVDLRVAYPGMFVDYYYDVHLAKTAKDREGFNAGAAAGNLLSRPRRSSAVEDLVAWGFGTITSQPRQDVIGFGAWKAGRWTVIMSRPLTTPDEADAQFKPGESTLVNFAVWDGRHRQRNGQKSVTLMWWPLHLSPAR